jgi:hypothetical protein
MAQKVYINDTGTPGYSGSGRGTPTEGDRGAWDAENYPLIHTNDTDIGVNAIHHTIGTGSWVAAAGNHGHILIELSSGSSLYGQLLTSIGSGSATWLYLLDHSHAGSVVGDGGKIGIESLTSESASSLFVLTADGSGSAAWQPADSWRVGLIEDTNPNDSDKTFTVPVNKEWQILWVWVEYTCTATYGVRQIEIQLQTSSSNIMGQLPAATPQDQSLTYKYLFGIASQDMTSPRDFDYITTPLPAGTFLSAGQKIRIWDNKVRDPSADDMIIRMQYAQRTV